MANWDWEVEEDFVSNMLQSLDARMQGIAASENRTGVVYDERMLRHYCTWNDEYTEKPDRLQACLDRCQQLFPRCHSVQSRFATEAEMTLLHDPELVGKLRSISASSEEEMKDLAKKYDYIYFHPAVFENASLALGSSIQLVEEILSNKLNNGMALVRPPGHHAMKSRFCGYCYLNNVATAAQYALDNHGLERILIVDWDVHHGQGTQFMFYDDPRVLYFSIHRHEHGQEWPNLDEAEYTFVGEGQGLGYNINVPLNVKGCDDSDYLAIILQILLPVAFEFSPQLVLVSAGYDAAMGCPEGEMQVSPAFFAHVVNLLSSLAEGKICLILEGGYCLQSLAESAALSLQALLGDPCPPIGSITAPCDSIRESILNCLKVLRLYWPSLCYQGEGIDSLSYASLLHWPQGGSQTRGTMEEFELDEPCYNINDDDLILSYVKKVELLIANAQYRATSKRVCLAYNSAMLDHKHLRDQGFPERAQRLSRIEQRLRDWGLLERCSLLKGRQATDEELRLVHRDSHINRMKNLAEMEEEALLKYHLTFNSVCVCKETHRVACLAVGSVLDVVDEVMADKAASGVAVIRPPGHHAEEGQPMGFCIYNNVAIAAKYALKNHNVERVLILDWDVHHGNGIQRVFYEDDRVLYISIHRFDDGMFFPCGSDGHKSRVGKGKGQGYNVNISWARGRMMGDTEYIAAFQQIVLPIAYEFCPDLVLISAGFDAAREDYLGGYKLSPQCFGVMTKLLMGLANSRIILVLEGGYNLEMTAASVAVCTSVLLGDPCPLLSTPPTRPLQIAVDTIKSVISNQSEHWKSLCFQVDLPDADFVKRISGGKLESSGSSSSVQRCKEQTESAEVFETSTPGSSNAVEKEANSTSEDVHKDLTGLKLES